MRAARAALPQAERRAAADAVTEALLALDELGEPGPLLLYAAFGDELRVDQAIDRLLRRGVTVCLPRVDGAEVDVVPISSLGDLVPGWRGVREPPPGTPAIPPTALRAAVVPGLAFDTRGNRLGYGGGHFDRLLARLDPAAVVIGVAYDLQVVDALPAEAHDRPVQVVRTECRELRPC
jgi:5-formyltetrahydrofolate cyclo-ligase